MASLNISQCGKAVKRSSRKPIPGVDLTAMVDLAFLLITFFMLTTSLGKMSAMDIAKPVPVETPANLAHWPASRTMTVLLGRNNMVVYYLGEAVNSTMSATNLAAIRAVILRNKEIVANANRTSSEKEMYVIIKPTSTSVYRNFVDILDELNINKINTYAIDDKNMLAEEINFMKKKGI